MNTSNSVVAEYSFDAWGRRRNPADWSYSLTGQPELFAGRGFTGHEHLPWFNLVNMNGRLYDPLVGRFLSCDNFVQDPSFTQSYNRYSYCWNNPLKYTDPNGYRLYMRNMPQSNDGRSGGNWEPDIYTRDGGRGLSGWYSAYTQAFLRGDTQGEDSGLETSLNIGASTTSLIVAAKAGTPAGIATSVGYEYAIYICGILLLIMGNPSINYIEILISNIFKEPHMKFQVNNK